MAIAIAATAIAGIAALWLTGPREPKAAAAMARIELAMPPPPLPPSPPPTPVAAVIPPPAPAPKPAAVAPAILPPPPPAPSPRDRSTAQPLLPAPDPALVEHGPNGPLPIIGRDGREPWRVYARPFDRADKRPRIAVIVSGLGPSGAATETAINDLPGAVTLAFDPYARRLPEWIDLARAAGHEVLLALPMEPTEYPRQDPGPYTLLTSLAPKDNLERLDWVLSRVTGYIGVTNMMGSRFTASQSNLAPIFEELKKRGLMFVDSRASEQSVAGAVAQAMGLPRASNDETLDQEATRDAIDRHLAMLEQRARQRGTALGFGFAYPVTIERVALWAKALDEKGLALAPASALAPLAGTPEHKATAR